MSCEVDYYFYHLFELYVACVKIISILCVCVWAHVYLRGTLLSYAPPP